jgi:hypothetical protein
MPVPGSALRYFAFHHHADNRREGATGEPALAGLFFDESSTKLREAKANNRFDRGFSLGI